jgi:hypothetical protein
MADESGGVNVADELSLRGWAVAPALIDVIPGRGL